MKTTGNLFRNFAVDFKKPCVLAAKLAVIACLTQSGLQTGLAQTVPPVIVLQPQSKAIALGYDVTFMAGISNRAPNLPYPTVQWFKNGQLIPGATNANLTEDQNNAYYNFTITNVQSTDAGTYAAALTNAIGPGFSSNAVLTITQPYTFLTMAGKAGFSGTNDGTGPAAEFYLTKHVAVDAGGNLYVTDHSNETVRVITPAGVVSTLAGERGVVGTNDGVGAQAQFNGPHGIAVDGAGNIFVTDIYNDTIREISPGGLVTTIAGLAKVSGWHDGVGGVGGVARFADPWGVAVDGADNLYVSDTGNMVIRKITPVGTNWVVSTIAGFPDFPGNSDGTNSGARFNAPDGLVVDGAGELFVADEGPQAESIRKITPVGTNWVVTTIAGHGEGYQDGIGTNAMFQGPTDVARDTNGNLYVTDIGNQVIREIVPVGTNWSVTTIAGSFEKTGAVDGTGVAARFYNPHGIAVDGSGNLYVVQGGNEIVSKGWVAGTPPAASLNTMQITNNEAQFKLTITTGFPTNLTVLQADQVTGPWITNTSAAWVTNVSGISYGITAPRATNTAGFYRVQFQ